MTSEIVLREEYVERFFQFIDERHAIYVRRNRGDEWPWTTDEILQTFKFCNIFRELDTGTIYCREYIREPYADDPDLFFNIAQYRLYNWIPTAIMLGYMMSYDGPATVAMVEACKAKGIKVFTGAHMITGTLGGTKIEQVFGKCIPALWENRRELEPKPGDTLESAFKKLNGNTPGFGPFISYEVVTDLRHTRYLESAPDIMLWANPGPGAKRGICRMMGLRVRSKKYGWPSKEIRAQYPSYDEYVDVMSYLLSISDDYVSQRVPMLEMRDIEHSLCEFDKYERARLGEGRPRSKYVPPS